MRTVTFSDEAVTKAVNGTFLSSWINRNPKFHNCDLGEEKRIFETSYECYATKNFCTFFVTPDLEVLHYFSGYYSPGFFLKEIEFVKALAKKACDEKGRLKKDGMAAYRAMHKEHAAAHAGDAKTVSKAKPPSAGSDGWDEYQKNQEKWNLRKTYLLEGVRYLDKVHETLAKGDRKTGRPLKLDRVIKNYQGGNEFTEE
jgi:hypothetical protein